MDTSFESLVSRAGEIEGQLDLGALLKLGIRPRRVTFDVSHSVVVYPHNHQMGEIGEKDIFFKPIDNAALYFHFPFCTGKCKYCHYVSFPRLKDAIVDEYISLLKKEIDLALKTGQFENAAIHSVFCGGGTPTCLDSWHLAEIMGFVFDSFKVEKGAEFTMEASPETITAEKAAFMKDAGVNRISVGFQDFSNHILKEIGRRHDSETARKAYATLKDAGIECVNIDLMLGLPDQRMHNIEGMLKGVEEIGPDSVTIYSTRLKTHVPMYKTFVEEPLRFPTERELLRMRIILQEGLKELGYAQKHLRWFVREDKDTLRYQTHKLSETANLAGFGLSAYSFVNGCQYINHDSLGLYRKDINAGKMPIMRGKCLTSGEAARRTLIFGIKAGINKRAFKERHGFLPEDIFGMELDALEGLGLIENGKKEIRLTYKDTLVGEEISGRFAAT